jgi:hypothetical protein
MALGMTYPLWNKSFSLIEDSIHACMTGIVMFISIKSSFVRRTNSSRGTWMTRQVPSPGFRKFSCSLDLWIPRRSLASATTLRTQTTDRTTWNGLLCEDMIRVRHDQMPVYLTVPGRYLSCTGSPVGSLRPRFERCSESVWKCVKPPK